MAYANKADRRRHDREYRAKCIAEGRCSKCKNSAEEGKTLCTACLAKQTKNRMALYNELKRDRKCIACGDLLEESYTGVRCAECKEIRRFKQLFKED